MEIHAKADAMFGAIVVLAALLSNRGSLQKLLQGMTPELPCPVVQLLGLFISEIC